MIPLLAAEGLAIEGRLHPTRLSLQSGALVAVVGPNGGGKTSLLRALARVEEARGSVTIDGEDVDQVGENRRRRLLSFLPASRDVAWPIRVRDFLALSLAALDQARVERLLCLLELDRLADRPINSLSTGERARVMLGRALGPRARLMLLDEPLSNLDPYWVLRTIEILRAELAASGGAALVAVHDLSLLPAFDRAILVAGGSTQADCAPNDLLAGQMMQKVFGVEPAANGWRISSPAGRRSSP